MKKYSIFDEPVKIFGLPFAEKTKSLSRLPDDLIEKLPQLQHFGKRSHGARFAFKTNSETITIKAELETLSFDVGMSIFACQSFEVFAGERESSRYLGLVNPPDYETKTFERTFHKTSETQEITVFFPRNEIVKSVEIYVEDSAQMLPPTPYKYPVPVVFYGSSITEGGHANNVSGGYSAILSRRLDFDYINLGFSGSAKGEKEIAEFINTLDMSAFVYDYDFNAPDVEYLENTHSRFFDIIRKKNPQLPVLFLSRPKAEYDEEEKLRRDVILKTFNNALAKGDENVYFIDGETLFGSDNDRFLCSTDATHPNDLGFYRMAQVIEPVMKQMLEKKQLNSRMS